MDSHSQPAGLPVEQKSTIGQFLWIGFYSTLLMIPTLTLFRFWARTQMRRRLWADTIIDGEPLEYIGKGSELLIGFLIAIFTISIPVVAVLFATQLFIGEILVVASLIALIYLALFVLVGVAVFLARRYQLSRTLWRGVRFTQEGNPLAFGLITFGYILLSIVTLGWFAPVARLRLAKRMWGNVKFGDLDFAYDNSREARTEPVWASFALSWFGVLLYYVAFGAGMYAIGAFQDPTAMADPMMVLQVYGLIFGLAIPLILMVAWHEAVMLRQITKSISVGGVSLSSRLSAWDIIELSFTNLLLIVFTLGFGYMAAQMRVWRRIARRIEAQGALDYAAISQAANRGPRTGEGMADAFDISGGV